MAGSYNHVITDNGSLRDNESFAQMIENLGDAYEAVEEMYGMIWMLAHMAANGPALPPAEMVEEARKNYIYGLELAKQTPGKEKKI